MLVQRQLEKALGTVPLDVCSCLVVQSIASVLGVQEHGLIQQSVSKGPEHRTRWSTFRDEMQRCTRGRRKNGGKTGEKAAMEPLKMPSRELIVPSMFSCSHNNADHCSMTHGGRRTEAVWTYQREREVALLLFAERQRTDDAAVRR